jgi:hypothetical protein
MVVVKWKMNGNGKMKMGMKGKEEEGTRKWDDMGPVPINLWANGVMKYCMNEWT